MFLCAIFVGSGAYAGCAYCTQTGEYSENLDKMVYLDHRRFLPQNDLLRSLDKDFPSGEVCHLDPPDEKNQDYVDRENVVFSSLATKKEQAQYSRKTGCKGSYALRRLPHHDRYNNTPVEPMHTIKNISERITKFIVGVTDTAKVRAEEEDRNRFAQPHCSKTVLEKGLPTAKFRLTKAEITTANKRALDIRTPHGFDWSSEAFFKQGVHFKSIRWINIIGAGIMKYCIRDCLGSFQRRTIFELCDVIQLILSGDIDLSLIDALEYRVHRVLSLLERDFPVSIHVIMLHLLHHLPMFIRRFGPVHGYWMFSMERFNSWISRRVHNRRFPEATVLESYRLFELSFFSQISGLLPDNSVIDVSQIDLDTDYDVDVHKHGNVPKDTQVHIKTLNQSQLDALKRYYDCENETHDQTLAEKPENKIKVLKYCTKVNKHNRNVTYSCKEKSLKHSSHIVYMKSEEGAVQFGEITLIFEHCFQHKTNTLVLVKWFGHYEVDTESKLIKIDPRIQSLSPNSIVSPSSLSKPLVHAYDSEDGELWILNCDLKLTISA